MMKDDKENTCILSAQIPTAWKDFLKQKAEDNDMTISAIIRKSLKNLFPQGLNL